MSSVLVIDNDHGVCEVLREALSAAGLHVHLASTGQEGYLKCLKHRPNVTFVELSLPDMTGLDVLTRLRRDHVATTPIVITEFPTLMSAINAMRLGAVDFLEKPVGVGQIVSLALAATKEPSVPLVVKCHPADRWASLILPIVLSSRDVKCLAAWASCAALSVGAIRSWCHAAGLRAKPSLDFGRMLRVVFRAQIDATPVEHMLDVIDRRTVARLRSLGDECSRGEYQMPRTTDEYLRKQKWIDDVWALDAVRQALDDRVADRVSTNSHY